MSILNSKTYIEDLKFVVENTDIFNCFKGKSIFITGGTGLIGSGIVDLLLMANSLKDLNIRIVVAARNECKAASRFSDFPDDSVIENLSYIPYDATRKNSLNFKADYIIHAASNVYPKASVRKSWTKMTEKLMENELYAA